MYHSMPVLLLVSVVAFTGSVAADSGVRELDRQVVGPNSVTVVVEQLEHEGDYFQCRFRVSDNKGVPLFASEWLYCPIVISKANAQVLVCDGNGVDQGDGPSLLALDGKLVARLRHAGMLDSCGISNDGLYYWRIYNDWSDPNNPASKPVSQLLVSDAKGAVFFQRKYLAKGAATFVRDNKSYKIAIPEPHDPQ